MNKVVFVKASFSLDIRSRKCKINTEDLTKGLQEAVKLLNEGGWEVVSVTDVISGEYDYALEWGVGAGRGMGYGYSYTDGLMIVARKV